jgi:hypothetical protein
MAIKISDKEKKAVKKLSKSSRMPHTEIPMAEKDEVKAAEERTKEGMGRARSKKI